MNAMPNLSFPPRKPTPAEYLAQLERWLAECDVHRTPAEIAQIAADQAKRIGVMK